MTNNAKTEKIRIRPKNDPAHPGIEIWVDDENSFSWCGWLAESLVGSGSVNGFPMDTWELVPPPIPTAPGTVFEATVRGVPNVRVFVVDTVYCDRYLTAKAIDGDGWHRADHIDPATVRILLEAPEGD